MQIEPRPPSGGSMVDVLDRVLDKGVVIDADVRIGVIGLELVQVQTRVVIASLETYLRHADIITYIMASPDPDSRPAWAPGW